MFRKTCLLALASSVSACGLPHEGPNLERNGEVAQATSADSVQCLTATEAATKPPVYLAEAAKPYFFARCMTDKGWQVKYEHNWYHFR
jgi:hypothetical protein